MTIRQPLVGSLRVLSITIQSPWEEYKSTPENLPTSEPSSPQISYTVSSSDLPSFNIEPTDVKYVAIIDTSGKNESGSYTTVYEKTLKNGEEVYTRSRNVIANYYWSFNAYFYDVSVGDTLEVKMWAAKSGFKWDYQLRQIQPTRIELFPQYKCLWEYRTEDIVQEPTASEGPATYYGKANYFVYHECEEVFGNRGPSYSTSINFSPWHPSPTYKLFALGQGDISYRNDIWAGAYSSYHPYIFRNYIPTKLYIRPLLYHD